MPTRGRFATRVTRLVASVVSVALVAVLGLVVPAGAAKAEGGHGGKDVVSTTVRYVETFYPLWFTHFQFRAAPHNKLIGPDKISPLYQGVVAINDDTLYASSPIDVSAGPVILSVPETPAGYSVLLLDSYGNTYTSGVPSKPAGVTTPTTIYELVGPDDPGGSVPGAVTVHLPLEFMAIIFRADKFNGTVDETAEATTFRADLTMNGLFTDIRPVAEFALPFKTIADTLVRVLPVTFLKQLQAAVADTSIRPPLSPADQQLSDDFDALFGDGSNLGLAQRVKFASGARSAHTAIVDNYLDTRGTTNWTHFTNIGQWGTAVLDRSSITEFCQFCNAIDTAAYYHAFYDGNGAALDGSNPDGYVMTFAPPGTPGASRFWSLTAYTPNAVELIPNPLKKYVVASYTPGLVTNPDGTISIYLSKTKPTGGPEANWLPVATRPFNVMLRVYGVVPDSSVATNTYTPPPIQRR